MKFMTFIWNGIEKYGVADEEKQIVWDIATSQKIVE